MLLLLSSASISGDTVSCLPTKKLPIRRFQMCVYMPYYGMAMNKTCSGCTGSSLASSTEWSWSPTNFKSCFHVCSPHRNTVLKCTAPYSLKDLEKEDPRRRKRTKENWCPHLDWIIWTPGCLVLPGCGCETWLCMSWMCQHYSNNSLDSVQAGPGLRTASSWFRYDRQNWLGLGPWGRGRVNAWLLSWNLKRLEAWSVDATRGKGQHNLLFNPLFLTWRRYSTYTSTVAYCNSGIINHGRCNLTHLFVCSSVPVCCTVKPPYYSAVCNKCSWTILK